MVSNLLRHSKWNEASHYLFQALNLRLFRNKSASKTEIKKSIDTYIISLRAVRPEIDALRRGELGRCVRKSSHLFGSLRLGAKLSHRESMRPL